MKKSKELYKAQEIIHQYEFLPVEQARKCAIIAANICREIYYYQNDYWDAVHEILVHEPLEYLIIAEKPNVYE